MRGAARPKFDPQSLMYFRRELAGYATAISPDDPTKALKVLNPTMLEIAELCTGYSTVDEIKRFFALRYNNDPLGVVGGQVDEALLLLKLYGLLTVESETEHPAADSEEVEVRRLEEWDFSALRTFLAGGAFPDKEHPPRVHYRHPYVTVEVYTELLIRMRLFHQKEHCYALTRGGNVEFLMSLFDERPLKPAASVAMIAGIEAIPVAEGLARVFPLAQSDLTGRVAKLQWRSVADGSTDESLAGVFEQLGFRLEATIADEFGPGKHERIWGKLLGQGGGGAETAAVGSAGGEYGCDPH